MGFFLEDGCVVRSDRLQKKFNHTVCMASGSGWENNNLLLLGMYYAVNITS